LAVIWFEQRISIWGGIFKMKKFEDIAVVIAISMPNYTYITSKHFEKIAQGLGARLNNLGADGWELVQHTDGFFKREVIF